ncbi:MAG: hypothetical protein QOH36_1089 [Actinomycetota bacterium]|nr:hypothetical protein [Actinomycetota bacterium]
MPGLAARPGGIRAGRPRLRSRPARRLVVRSERGSGPISAWLAFVVFLGLLLFAVQALFNLYATSVVTAVAYDAARRVAVADGGTANTGPAEADARRALGRFGQRVTFDWSASDGEFVVLSVRARNPTRLLPAMAGPLAFDEIDRTVRVRVETFQSTASPTGVAR